MPDLIVVTHMRHSVSFVFYLVLRFDDTDSIVVHVVINHDLHVRHVVQSAREDVHVGRVRHRFVALGREEDGRVGHVCEIEWGGLRWVPHVSIRITV